MSPKRKRFLRDLWQEERKTIYVYLAFIVIAVFVLGVFATFIVMGYAIASLRPLHINTADELKYAIEYYQTVTPFFFWFAIFFSAIIFFQFSSYGRKTKILASALLTAVNSFIAWGMWLQPKAIDKISKKLNITDYTILEKAAGLGFTSEHYHFWLSFVLVAIAVNLLANAINDK
jgi:hypothetical protein